MATCTRRGWVTTTCLTAPAVGPLRTHCAFDEDCLADLQAELAVHTGVPVPEQRLVIAGTDTYVRSRGCGADTVLAAALPESTLPQVQPGEAPREDIEVHLWLARGTATITALARDQPHLLLPEAVDVDEGAVDAADGAVDTHCGGPDAFILNRPMSKFEHTVVIAHRASQLSQGARPRAHCADGSQASLDIAAAELDTGVIRGMRVGRYGPDGVVVQKEVESMHIARRRVRPW